MNEVLFHVDFDICQRSRGNNAVKLLAYMRCARITDSDGTVFNFSRKRNEHQGSDLLLPASAPVWANDAVEIFRRSELAEKRIDAQTARAIELAIPRGLPTEMEQEFCRYVFKPFSEKGMAVSLDRHSVTAADGNENRHVHALLTMRKFEGDGFSSTKERSWNDWFRDDRGRVVRGLIADRMNSFMRMRSVPLFVDHRSNKTRGIDIAPEPDLPKKIFKAKRENPNFHSSIYDQLIKERGIRNAMREKQIKYQQLKMEYYTMKNDLKNSDTTEIKPASYNREKQKRFIAMTTKRILGTSFLDAGKFDLFKAVGYSKTDPTTAKWVTLEGSQIISANDRFVIQSSTDDAIQAALVLAEVRGWSTVNLEGEDEDFKRRFTLAAMAHKPPIRTNYELSSNDAAAALKVAYQKDFDWLKRLERNCQTASIFPENDAFQKLRLAKISRRMNDPEFLLRCWKSAVSAWITADTEAHAEIAKERNPEPEVDISELDFSEIDQMIGMSL